MWKTLSLDEIVDISIGKTPSRKEKRYWDVEKQSNNVWLSIADLKDHQRNFVSDSKEYISDIGASLFRPVPANTLIMSFKLSIGRVAFTACELWTNEAIAALKIKNEKQITREYLRYFLMSLDWEKIAGADQKVKGKTLNKSKLKKLPVAFPPIAEQQRIVAKLDAAFAEIDAAIQSAKSKEDEIKKLKTSLLSNFLKGNASMWKLVRLGDVAKAVGGNGFPKKYQSNTDKLIPFFKVSDMNTAGNEIEMRSANNYVDESELKEMKAKCHPTGTVIFPKIGGAISTNKKRLLKCDAAFDNNVMGVIPENRVILPEFLYKIFLSMDLYELSNKAALPSITKGAVEEIAIHLPSIAEQKSIVDQIDAAFVALERVDYAVKKQQENYQHLLSAILAAELQNEAA